MGLRYSVPKKKKIRLIINTDAKNEADDQYAIVHALLTPKFDIKHICAAHFGLWRTEESMEESYKEVEKILELTGYKNSIELYKGAHQAIKDENTPEISEGAQALIKEALRDDSMPLFAIFLGPLTDLATAYMLEPKIAEKLTVIWIGGGLWPDGCHEFNLANDRHAANVVFKSSIPMWQVPIDVYSKMCVGIAELQYKIYPYGKVGKYLFEQLVEFNDLLGDNIGFPSGETWGMGDSAAIGLLLNQQSFEYKKIEAPIVDENYAYILDKKNRKIRVYHTIDSRFILEDMFSKMVLNYGRD